MRTKPKFRTTKSRDMVSKLKRHYRKLCENSKDPFEARMAQAMENTLMWLTEETVGWKMTKAPREYGDCLKSDLGVKK